MFIHLKDLRLAAVKNPGLTHLKAKERRLCIHTIAKREIIFASW
jgi:hypothetical protein